MYLVKTPNLIQNLFPNFIWRMPQGDQKIFLTFDDGPIPDVTPWVLDQLSKYNAKATFFCVGDNVRKHPDVYNQVKEENHCIGSHTFNHLSGWGTENVPYFLNVRRGAKSVQSEFFRPPYGRIKPSQVPFLMRHYKIIMWDVLSGDFDPKISAQQCLNNVLSHTKAGSIVVFHDSVKSFEKLKYVLPRVLEHFHSLGYSFCGIDDISLKDSAPLAKTA